MLPFCLSTWWYVSLPMTGPGRSFFVITDDKRLHVKMLSSCSIPVLGMRAGFLVCLIPPAEGVSNWLCAKERGLAQGKAVQANTSSAVLAPNNYTYWIPPPPPVDPATPPPPPSSPGGVVGIDVSMLPPGLAVTWSPWCSDFCCQWHVISWSRPFLEVT